VITASTSKRDRRGAMTREITYQRVLLAVYMLSDDDGVACDESVARIGLECGHGGEAVSRSIRTMIERGIVRTLDVRDGLNRRILVLADHPRAGAFIAGVKARIAAKRRAEYEQRVASKKGRG
jgi:hypothetical protein